MYVCVYIYVFETLLSLLRMRSTARIYTNHRILSHVFALIMEDLILIDLHTTKHTFSFIGHIIHSLYPNNFIVATYVYTQVLPS